MKLQQACEMGWETDLSRLASALALNSATTLQETYDAGLTGAQVIDMDGVALDGIYLKHSGVDASIRCGTDPAAAIERQYFGVEDGAVHVGSQLQVNGQGPNLGAEVILSPDTLAQVGPLAGLSLGSIVATAPAPDQPSPPVNFIASSYSGGAPHAHNAYIILTGTGATASKLDFFVEAAAHLELVQPATLETALSTRVNRAGVFTLDRITLGAADSGGTGKRALVVAN